jgi:DNA-binding XRE family transcriptional regulator
MNIGHQLLVLRERLGLTQQQLADQCGVKSATIWKIEAGMRTGNLETWIKIKQGTGCSLDEMVGLQ